MAAASSVKMPTWGKSRRLRGWRPGKSAFMAATWSSGASTSERVEQRREELQQMKVGKELRQLCEEYGLKKTGKKADIVERILEHEEEMLEAETVADEVGARAEEEFVESLRRLTMGKYGPEASPMLHIEAFRRAIEATYRNMWRTVYADLPEGKRGVAVNLDSSGISEAGRKATIEVSAYGDEGELLSTSDDTEAFWSIVTDDGDGAIMRAITRRYKEEMRALAARERAKGMEARLGSLERARVTRVDPETGVVSLELREGIPARLPREEQTPGEELNEGQDIAVTVMQVDESEEPVRVSRAAPEMVVAALEEHVPEMKRGEVEAIQAARIPGKLAKVAVDSPHNVFGNPVHPCLGDNSSRLSRIRKEIGGEKVSIVRWAEKLEDRIRYALHPGILKRIELPASPGQKALVVAPSSSDKGKAIGERAHNRRLAEEIAGISLLIREEWELIRNAAPHDSPAESAPSVGLSGQTHLVELSGDEEVGSPLDNSQGTPLTGSELEEIAVAGLDEDQDGLSEDEDVDSLESVLEGLDSSDEYTGIDIDAAPE